MPANTGEHTSTDPVYKLTLIPRYSRIPIPNTVDCEAIFNDNQSQEYIVVSNGETIRVSKQSTSDYGRMVREATNLNCTGACCGSGCLSFEIVTNHNRGSDESTEEQCSECGVIRPS
jgi:hypothetical protein